MPAKTSSDIFSSAKSFLILFILCIVSCRSDDNTTVKNGIDSQWKLIEVLADPEDGSGQFTAVESSRPINILENGTYTSNGALCKFSFDADTPTNGSIDEDDEGYYLECDMPFAGELRITPDEGFLIIAIFCIEPCLHKYERTD